MTMRKPTSAHLKSTKEQERVKKKRAPKKGYSSTEHVSRSEREKSYVHPVDFSLLVQNENIHKAQDAAMNKAFQVLYDAELLDSKSQFCAMMLYGLMTPVPIEDAAAICSCSRNWFHKLDFDGRIKLLRPKSRKLFLRADDITRILQGTV